MVTLRSETLEWSILGADPTEVVNIALSVSAGLASRDLPLDVSPYVALPQLESPGTGGRGEASSTHISTGGRAIESFLLERGVRTDFPRITARAQSLHNRRPATLHPRRLALRAGMTGRVEIETR